MATTTGHERSKTLHNFSLPNLWRTQRQVRCVKVDDPDGGGSSSGGDQRLRRRSSNFEIRNESRRFKLDDSSEKEGIEEFREKIMLDLRNVADKVKESIFGVQVQGNDEREREFSPPEATVEAMPWKLRKRRAPISGIDSNRSKGLGIEENKRVNDSISGDEGIMMKESIFGEQFPGNDQEERDISPTEATVEVRPWKLRKRKADCKAPISGIDSNRSKGLGIEEKKRVNDSISGDGLRKERSRLLDTLSKKEIEEDYMKMMGQRPPRRPTKRSKTLQNKIDMLNPASYITEITEDLYHVPKQAKKRKR